MIDAFEVREIEARLRKTSSDPSGSELFDQYTDVRDILVTALDYLQTAVDEREKETERADAAEEKLAERE